MLHEILRLLRRGMLGKVGFFADDREAEIRSDASRDHVFRKLFAHADPGVKALRHDVGEAVVEQEFDLDVGIFREKAFQLGPKDAADCIVGR
ncbi:hypothetical protein X737_17750 [Mesorhizobium sp. L48C026A00]|nr:hypothetical protein X737_17750 [Mesorhizobium sp. L48C026A00]